jgi:hypothetical protein
LKNSMLPKLHIDLFLLSNHVKLEKFYATKLVYMYTAYHNKPFYIFFLAFLAFFAIGSVISFHRPFCFSNLLAVNYLFCGVLRTNDAY